MKNILSDKRILIVEDEPGIARVLKLFLNEKGANVDIAITYATANGFLKLYKYDVIISDWLLLDDVNALTGIDLLTTVREGNKAILTEKNVPFIIFTAYNQEHHYKVVNDLDGQMLTKPKNPKDIVDTVAHLIKLKNNNDYNKVSLNDK